MNSARGRWDATRAGWLAAGRGQPVTTCPHRLDGPDDEAALAVCWTRGYASHPTAAGSVDYGD